MNAPHLNPRSDSAPLPMPTDSPATRHLQTDPLDALLQRAVRQSSSRVVRDWLAALLRSGERAQDLMPDEVRDGDKERRAP